MDIPRFGGKVPILMELYIFVGFTLDFYSKGLKKKKKPRKIIPLNWTHCYTNGWTQTVVCSFEVKLILSSLF